MRQRVCRFRGSAVSSADMPRSVSAGLARLTMRARGARGSWITERAGDAVAEQARVTAGPAGPVTRAALTKQQPAGAADTAGGTVSPGPTYATIADHPRRPAATRHPCRIGRPRPTVAEEQPARTTSGLGQRSPRRPRRTITDQGPPQQPLGGPIDNRVHHL